MESQPTPLYYQLKMRLLEEIRSGAYGSDGRLPTEHELCARYGLSRTPVTRALSELAHEGVVLRRRRRGTFVNPGWLRRSSTQAPELRLVVPGGAWPDHLREAAGRDVSLSITAVELPHVHDVLLRAIAEGNGPDLAVVDSVHLAEFARSGFLMPLDDLDGEWIAREHDTDFLSPFAEAYRFGGHTLAVHAHADAAGLWLRRDLLEGSEPPADWRGLRTLARRLTTGRARDFRPMVMSGGPAAAETTTYCLTALLASNGATVLSPGAVTLDSPAAVEAMRFLRRLVDDGALPAEVTAYDKHRAPRLLAGGAAGICLGGSYDAEEIAAEAGLDMEEVYERFVFAPMPPGPHGGSGVLSGGMVYCVPRQAKRPGLAMRVLRAAVEPHALIRLCTRTGQLPPRRSALEAIAVASPFHAHTAAMLDHMVVRPSSPVYALVSAQLQAMTEDVITRRRSPAAAVARAADLISAITGLPVSGR